MRVFWLCCALVGFVGCGDDDVSDAGQDGAVGDAGEDTAADGAPADGFADVMDATVDAFTNDPFLGPRRRCPGEEGCASGSGTLRVGAAMADITPTFDETTEIQTSDDDGDGIWDVGEGFRDTDDDGVFDGLWIAGFGAGRPASGVGDPQWARAIVFENEDTKVALVSLDVVGFMYDDVLAVRERLAGDDVDYVIVSSTHTHEARDTMGRWGQDLGTTGIDDDYQSFIYDQAAAAVRAAAAAVRPADIDYASTFLRDQPGGVRRYVGDSRDPQVIDDEIRLMRFVETGTDTTIATLVNFGSHPEFAGNRNTLLSSDFAHTLRTGIEGGAEGPGEEMVPGVGGICVYYQGAVGSQIGPLNLESPQEFDGTPLEEDTVEGAHKLGAQLAYFSLKALETATREEGGDLAFRSRELGLRVENAFFHVAFNVGLFPTRAIRLDRPGAPASDSNRGIIVSEVGMLDVGRTRMILMPGELDPALFLGGYDGSYRADRPVNGDGEHAPDLSMAPEAPYLRDIAGEPEGIDHVYLLGLANDEVGYLVPAFDYKLHPLVPYLVEAPGRHYQETVSLGPDAWPQIEEALLSILRWEE